MNNVLQLPTSWQIKTLGEVLNYEQPTKYIVKSTKYNDSYKTPVLTAGKSFILGYTDELEGIFTQIPVIIFDDFTTDTKFVDFKFKVKSSAMKILHSKENADIKFIYYFMQTIRHRSDTHKRYWISEYAKIKIPLPPLEIQKRIVARLESAFEKIEKGSAHLQDAKTKLAKYKQSLLKSAFDGTLTATASLRGVEKAEAIHKVDCHKSANANFHNDDKSVDCHDLTSSNLAMTDKENPKLPQGWTIKTLGEVCEICTGNSINKEKKEKEFMGLKEGLNYIATKDIGFDNTINYDNGVKIPFKDLKKFRVAKANVSLLCIEGGSAGRKIGFTNQEVCFVNKLCCFEALQDEPKFIYFYLQSSYFLQKFNLNMSGLIGGISKEKIKQIKIPLPPLETQKQIVKLLEKHLQHADKTGKFIESALNKAKQLKQSLLKSAFLGKLT